MVTFFDSFEDGDISEYNGDTSSFSVVQNNPFEGSFALEGPNVDNDDFLAILHDTESYGPDSSEPLSLYVRPNNPGTYVQGLVWGEQNGTGGGNISGYSASINGAGFFDLYKWTNGTNSRVAFQDVGSSADNYYRLVLTTWDQSGNIEVEARDVNGNTLATLSTTDVNYDTGNIGIIHEDFGTTQYDALQIGSGPSAPTNVQIIDDTTEDELTLGWDEVSDATGYYVYRAEQSGTTKADYTQVADVTTPPYTDTGLEDGERYYYRVSAYN